MKSVTNNKLAILTAAILGLSLSFSAFSAEDVDREARRAEMKAKFDVDGDGTLNKTERQAAREAHKQRRIERIDGDGTISDKERSAAKDKHRAKMIERFDADGDGELNEAERSVAKEKHREKMLKRFDTDGDGELNDTERQAAKEARDKFRERREENRNRKADVSNNS